MSLEANEDRVAGWLGADWIAAGLVVVCWFVLVHDECWSGDVRPCVDPYADVLVREPDDAYRWFARCGDDDHVRYRCRTCVPP